MKHERSEFYCEIKHVRFVRGKKLFFYFLLTFISGINNVFKKMLNKKRQELWRKDMIEWKL